LGPHCAALASDTAVAGRVGHLPEPIKARLLDDFVESISLQRRVGSEPDFHGRIPSMTIVEVQLEPSVPVRKTTLIETPPSNSAIPLPRAGSDRIGRHGDRRECRRRGDPGIALARRGSLSDEGYRTFVAVGCIFVKAS